MTTTPLTALSSLSQSIPIQEEAPAPGSGGEAFGKIFKEILSANAQANEKSNQAVLGLATGQAQDIHSISLAVAQADLSFRMILELRNRLTQAYQDVMAIQL